MHLMHPSVSEACSAVCIELQSKVKDNIIDPICWPWTTIVSHCSALSLSQL